MDVCWYEQGKMLGERFMALAHAQPEPPKGGCSFASDVPPVTSGKGHKAIKSRSN